MCVAEKYNETEGFHFNSVELENRNRRFSSSEMSWSDLVIFLLSLQNAILMWAAFYGMVNEFPGFYFSLSCIESGLANCENSLNFLTCVMAVLWNRMFAELVSWEETDFVVSYNLYVILFWSRESIKAANLMTFGQDFHGNSFETRKLPLVGIKILKFKELSSLKRHPCSNRSYSNRNFHKSVHSTISSALPPIRIIKKLQFKRLFQSQKTKKIMNNFS